MVIINIGNQKYFIIILIMFSQRLRRQTTKMSIQKTPEVQQVSAKTFFGKKKQEATKRVQTPIKTISPKDQIVGLDPQQYTQKYFLTLWQQVADPLVPGQLWRHSFVTQYPHQTSATVSIRPQSFVLSCVNSSQLPQVVWFNMTGSPGFMNNESNFSGAIAGFVLTQVNAVSYEGILSYNATYTCDDQATWDISVPSTSSFFVTYDDNPQPITQLFNPMYLRLFIKNKQIG